MYRYFRFINIYQSLATPTYATTDYRRVRTRDPKSSYRHVSTNNGYVVITIITWLGLRIRVCTLLSRHYVPTRVCISCINVVWLMPNMEDTAGLPSDVAKLHIALQTFIASELYFFLLNSNSYQIDLQLFVVLRSIPLRSRVAAEHIQ
jgi:hypothetical protein